MATVTKPIALDESFNTTEVTPRNIADVLAEELSRITGRNASQVEYDNTDSGLTADNVQDALDEIVEDIPTVPTVDIQTAVDEFETYNGGLLSSLKVSLSPNQDLHGYDSPWVGGSRKNKLENSYTSQTINGITFTVYSDGTVMAEEGGTATGAADFILGTFNSGGVATILNGCPSGGSSSTYALNATGGYSDTGSGVDLPASYNNQVYIRIRSGYTVPSGGLLFKPMIRLATESDPTFEPYSNICPISGHTQVDVDVSDGQATQEQVTVNLGGTYYSGTLDVVSGVLIPDTASVDLGTLTWEYVSGVNFFRCGDIGAKPPASTSDMPNAICEAYDGDTYNHIQNGENGFAIRSNGGLIIRDERFSDANAFKTAVTGIKLVYELATPTPIQLSPTMVKALVGENHLSAPLEGQEITESKYKQMFTFDDVIAYIQSLS